MDVLFHDLCNTAAWWKYGETKANNCGTSEPVLLFFQAQEWKHSVYLSCFWYIEEPKTAYNTIVVNTN